MVATMLNVPIGTVLDYVGNTVPSGYLECDGRAVSRSAYPALFAAIGTLWGAGDGSTTFNLPDLRGRTSIGAGTGTAGGATAHALASKGGDERSEMHHHVQRKEVANHGLASIVGSADMKQGVAGVSGDILNTTIQYGWYSNRYAVTTADSGGGSSGNMQPFATVRKLIRAA